MAKQNFLYKTIIIDLIRRRVHVYRRLNWTLNLENSYE